MLFLSSFEGVPGSPEKGQEKRQEAQGELGWSVGGTAQLPILWSLSIPAFLLALRWVPWNSFQLALEKPCLVRLHRGFVSPYGARARTCNCARRSSTPAAAH